MSDFETIRDAIVTRLNTVASIGQVHNRERYSADWSAYLGQFKNAATGDIRGWTVTFGGLTGTPYRGAANRRAYEFVIRGYLGLDDSANTETAFYNLVEAVLDALDGRTDLGDTDVIDFSVGPASVRAAEPRQLGSVLVHYAEIVYPVETVREVAYA